MLLVGWGAFGFLCLVTGLIMLGRNDARGIAKKALESNDPRQIHQVLALHMPREVRQRLERRLEELTKEKST